MHKMEVLTDSPGALLKALTDGDDGSLTVVSPNTTDAAQEKHVPVLKKITGSYEVLVGEVPHPMTAEHWIRFIELRTDKAVYRKFLDPGDPPKATSLVTDLQGPVTAVASCNLHGVWSGN